jgi:transposase-like protein
MSKQTRRKFSAEFKAKVALEAVKNQYTLSELGVKFELNPVVISKWKSEFLENMSSVFEKGTKKEEDTDPDIEQLYSQIGRLKVENEFLKKSCKKLGI